ncbi:hypothetical protein PENSPDRAFT_661512 [Peniophora sp. CONT]|nr:hypothetical protein PENSPDRAFT_661512 [Peniophora sp. CONT]
MSIIIRSCRDATGHHSSLTIIADPSTLPSQLTVQAELTPSGGSISIRSCVLSTSALNLYIPNSGSPFSSKVQASKPAHASRAPPPYDASGVTSLTMSATEGRAVSDDPPPPRCYICHPDLSAEVSNFVCPWDESDGKLQCSKELSGRGNPGRDDKVDLGKGTVAKTVEGPRDPRSRLRRFADNVSFIERCEVLLDICKADFKLYHSLYDGMKEVEWSRDELQEAASMLHSAQLRVDKLQKVCDERPLEFRGSYDVFYAKKIRKMNAELKEERRKLHELARKRGNAQGSSPF